MIPLDIRRNPIKIYIFQRYGVINDKISNLRKNKLNTGKSRFQDPVPSPKYFFFWHVSTGYCMQQWANFFKRILSKIMKTNNQRLVNNKIKLWNPHFVSKNHVFSIEFKRLIRNFLKNSFKKFGSLLHTVPRTDVPKKIIWTGYGVLKAGSSGIIRKHLFLLIFFDI